MTLGKRVRDRRAAAGLTQAQLAAKIPVSQGSVSDWESDKASPSIKMAGALAHALGVDLAWLVYGEGSVTATPVAEPGAT